MNEEFECNRDDEDREVRREGRGKNQSDYPYSRIPPFARVLSDIILGGI